MNRFSAAVAKWDNVSFTVLLWINAAIAALALLANGSVILMHYLSKAPELADHVSNSYVPTFAGLFGLLLSLLGLLVPSARAMALKAQTGLLLSLAAGALYFAYDVIVYGVALGKSFHWDPVMFAFVLAYPVYVARRTLLPQSALQIPFIRYAHVLAIAASIVISAGILWRYFAWSPSASDFVGRDSSQEESLSFPKAQDEPAVSETAWDGNTSGEAVTLLSTSFESAQGEGNVAMRPFVQSGTLPWGSDSRAHSGRNAINVIPNGNPGDLRYFGFDKSISDALLNSRLGGAYAPFRVGDFRRVELEFWRLSTSNPSLTHNCLGSLRVDYRFDAGPWQSKMVYCGTHKSHPIQWKRSELEFDTAGHRELEFRFDYEYPPDTQRDRNAAYLIDDLLVRGYR